MELQKAVERVRENYRSDEQRRDDEKRVIQYFGSVFSPANLHMLTADEFKSFLLFRNNKHWTGINRWGNIITSDMDKLRNALKILFDESKSLEERLSILRPQNRPPYIKGLGRAVLTPILLVTHPEKYAVYNFISGWGLKKIDKYPNLSENVSFSEKYARINDIIVQLAKENKLSLWQMDEVWWWITTDSLPFEADTEITPQQFEKREYPAGLESQLEDFLIANWETIPEFNDLEILQEDGDYIGHQYDLKDIGRIDLLCKHKKTGDFYVLELKRGQGSDKAVGQILKYIGWVMKNLATMGQKVYGIIITYEEDQKLRYAIEPVKDFIQLKTYKISISIS